MQRNNRSNNSRRHNERGFQPVIIHFIPEDGDKQDRRECKVKVGRMTVTGRVNSVIQFVITTQILCDIEIEHCQPLRGMPIIIGGKYTVKVPPVPPTVGVFHKKIDMSKAGKPVLEPI